MKKGQLNKIIREQVDCYINNIEIELEKSHNQFFDEFGFPMFGETSKDYYEQVYFQSYLESYTRKLINSVLREIIKYEVTDDIRWPEFDYIGICNGYTNIEYEKENKFEFININKRVGYRYAFFHKDEIENLLIHGDVDAIKLVEWQGVNEVIGDVYDDNRVDVINAWELFNDLLVETNNNELKTMYDLFVENIIKAVEHANSLISLKTIPGFTPMYIHKFRSEVMKNLTNEIEKLTIFHVKNTSYKYIEEDSKQLISDCKIEQRFLYKQMEKAFVGNSHYAKCFLTSEYLFTYFKNNPMFDYTPVVSGYIKSVEQLLYVICRSYQNYVHKNEDMRSWTLGSYEKYINNNDDIIRSKFQKYKLIILNCLKSYRKECRNKNFHRDYFNYWKQVEQIRKNTIFLFVALLAMIKDELIDDYDKILDIVDESYDQLFCAIDEDKSESYYIEYEDKVYNNMRKVPRYKGITYSWNGLIRNKISFIRNDYEHHEKLDISSRNMPLAIWSIDSLGRKKKLVWRAL